MSLFVQNVKLILIQILIKNSNLRGKKMVYQTVRAKNKKEAIKKIRAERQCVSEKDTITKIRASPSKKGLYVVAITKDKELEEDIVGKRFKR